MTEDDYVDVLVQDCGNSSASAMELPQSCTEPSLLWLLITWRPNHQQWYWHSSRNQRDIIWNLFQNKGHKDSHYKGKTVVRLSYPCNWNSYKDAVFRFRQPPSLSDFMKLNILVNFKGSVFRFFSWNFIFLGPKFFVLSISLIKLSKTTRILSH